MTYTPLHHKYRPKNFSQLVGQDAISTTLSNAIKTKKIANAYLFTGPRGTGKTSSARILAKSLNCLSSPEPTVEPCDNCETCKGISKGYSLDVIEIDAASNSGVDNVRELIERSQFAPVQSRYKVFIIDEVHGLSNQAFNALLKTLEEPPKYVVFILATTDPQRVLPTIISRCQKFDFRRIDTVSMCSHLRYISEAEGISINSDAINLVAQLSQGGLRDAESLLDQLGLYPDEVTPDRVWDLVGAVSENHLLDLVTAIHQGDSMAVVDSLESILDRGKEPLTILQNLANFYRDLLVAYAAPHRRQLTNCTESNWKSITELAKSITEVGILAGQKHLKESEIQLKNTTQPRLWLEISVLGLMEKAKTQVVQQVQNIQVNTDDINKSNVKSTQTNNQQTVKPVSQINSKSNENNKILESAINLIQSLPDRELLRRSLYVIDIGETVKLGIKPNMVSWFTRIMVNHLNLKLVFSKVLNKDIQVSIEIENKLSSTQSPVNKETKISEKVADVESIESKNISIKEDWSNLDFNDVARKLADMFDGKVVKCDNEENLKENILSDEIEL